MNPTHEEKLEKLKMFFAMSGKKFPGVPEAEKLIAKLDRMGLVSTLVAYGLGLAIYGAAGAIAGGLLHLNPLAAGAAFVIIRLALNYSPREEEVIAKITTEKRLITQAINDAPTDPAILSQILGQANYDSDNAPKA